MTFDYLKEAKAGAFNEVKSRTVLPLLSKTPRKVNSPFMVTNWFVQRGHPSRLNLHIDQAAPYCR